LKKRLCLCGFSEVLKIWKALYCKQCVSK
jgi:hypothetical protein